MTSRSSTSSCRGSARHRLPLPRPGPAQLFLPARAPRLPPLILEVSTGLGTLTSTGQRAGTGRYLQDQRLPGAARRCHGDVGLHRGRGTAVNPINGLCSPHAALHRPDPLRRSPGAGVPGLPRPRAARRHHGRAPRARRGRAPRAAAGGRGHGRLRGPALRAAAAADRPGHRSRAAAAVRRRAGGGAVPPVAPRAPVRARRRRRHRDDRRGGLRRPARPAGAHRRGGVPPPLHGAADPLPQLAPGRAARRRRRLTPPPPRSEQGWAPSPSVPGGGPAAGGPAALGALPRTPDGPAAARESGAGPPGRGQTPVISLDAWGSSVSAWTSPDSTSTAYSFFSPGSVTRSEERRVGEGGGET